MPILRYFNWPELSETKRNQLADQIDHVVGCKGSQLDAEACFHVVLAEKTDAIQFEKELGDRLEWLLSKPIGGGRVAKESQYVQQQVDNAIVVEIGPRYVRRLCNCVNAFARVSVQPQLRAIVFFRLSFTTAFSTNAVSACRSAGLDAIVRLEKSIRYQIAPSTPLTPDQRRAVVDLLGDRMTECEYVTPPDSFESQNTRQPVEEINLMTEGSMDILRQKNTEMGTPSQRKNEPNRSITDIVFRFGVRRRRSRLLPRSVRHSIAAQSDQCRAVRLGAI
jgi:hypothetical protein